MFVIKGVTAGDSQKFFSALHGLKSASAAQKDRIVSGQIIDLIIGPWGKRPGEDIEN